MENRRTIKILHIDDEPEDLELSTIKLSRLDESFDITGTVNPEEAWQLLQDNRYDCIVSDYQMPYCNGLELLKKIRESGSEVPFLLFTAQGDELLAAEAFNSGASDYFSKQMEFANYDRLANSIRRNVEHYRQQRQSQIVDRILAEVIETTAPYVGSEFFNALVLALQSALKVDVAFIGEVQEENIVETKAFALDSELIANVKNCYQGTPCSEIITLQKCVLKENLQKDYPNNPFIARQMMNCYIGCPLFNHKQELIGLLGVMSRRTVNNPELVMKLLQIFAMRVSVEIDRIAVLDKLKASEANYRSIFENVLEATVVIDPESITVIQANRAFREMFGYSSEEMIGKGGKFFSGVQERYRFEAATELVQRIKDKESVRARWLAKRANGEKFWLEASFKLAEINGEPAILVSPKDISDSKPVLPDDSDPESHFIILEQ